MGMGKSHSELLAREGAHVFVTDRETAAGEAVAKGIVAAGGKADFIKHDVASEDDWTKVIDTVRAKAGRLDILVNNAGIAGPAAPVHEVSTVDWTRSFAVNVNGQFFMARAAIPHLKRNAGGSIVCMASVAGKYAFPLRSPYAASKAAVIALARSLSVELGPDQIRVNAIAPGVVAGDRIRRVFTDRAQARGVSYDEMAATALRAVSMKTMVEPEEIAALVVYLTGPSGRPITGQVMQICGGLEYTE